MVDVWSMCQIENTEKAQEKLNLAEDQFNSISIFYLTIINLLSVPIIDHYLTKIKETLAI